MFESINDKEDVMSVAHSVCKQTKIKVTNGHFGENTDSLSCVELDEKIDEAT